MHAGATAIATARIVFKGLCTTIFGHVEALRFHEHHDHGSLVRKAFYAATGSRVAPMRGASAGGEDARACACRDAFGATLARHGASRWSPEIGCRYRAEWDLTWDLAQGVADHSARV
jgi:hypothetical protein